MLTGDCQGIPERKGPRQALWTAVLCCTGNCQLIVNKKDLADPVDCCIVLWYTGDCQGLVDKRNLAKHIKLLHYVV